MPEPLRSLGLVLDQNRDMTTLELGMRILRGVLLRLATMCASSGVYIDHGEVIGVSDTR